MTRKRAYDTLCRLLAPPSAGGSSPLAPDDPIWPVLFALADANFVLSELRQALFDRGWQDCAPAPMLDALNEAHRLTLERCRVLRGQMIEVTQVLAAIGVMPVWLKGAALLTEDDWQGRVRLMSDLDVWVPNSDHQAAALLALGRQGYMTKPSALEQDWSNSHHYAPLAHPQRVSTLELHRHVVRKVFGNLLPDAGAAGRLDIVDWNGLAVARLSLEDRIAHSLIQCSLMSTPPIDSGRIRLMKVVDLVRLIVRTGRYELPDAVVAVFAQSPWSRPMSRFLTLLERDFCVPNPLDHDSAYCEAVDCMTRRGRPPLRWRLGEMLQAPTDWRRFLLHPGEWGRKIGARLQYFWG